MISLDNRTKKKLTRINQNLSNEVLRGRFMDYIKDNVNCEGYEDQIVNNKTDLENSLFILITEFQRVALYRNNILRVGRKNCFIDYIQGLPSCVTFQFEYYKMYKDLEQIFEVESLDYLEVDEISSIYYFLLERAVNDLLECNNMIKLDDLENHII